MRNPEYSMFDSWLDTVSSTRCPDAPAPRQKSYIEQFTGQKFTPETEKTIYIVGTILILVGVAWYFGAKIEFGGGSGETRSSFTEHVPAPSKPYTAESYIVTKRDMKPFLKADITWPEVDARLKKMARKDPERAIAISRKVFDLVDQGIR